MKGEVIESKEVAPVGENLHKPFLKNETGRRKYLKDNYYMKDKATEEKASIGLKEIYDKQKSRWSELER